MSTPSLRPLPLWIATGLVLGSLSGAAVGAVTLAAAELVETSSLTWAGEAAAFGMAYGAAWGASTGPVVGLVLGVLAVGLPLPRDEARKRAYVYGTLVTAAVLGVALVPVLALGLLAVAIWVVGVLAAGPLCSWVAGLGRTPVDAS